jgi:hypothetical protein
MFHGLFNDARFEVFTAIKDPSRGILGLALPNVGTLPHHYTLKMEAVRSSETLVSNHITTT